MNVGDIIGEREVHLSRDSLVRYAGASGDFNPIHYRDDVAARVGLPGVLAHGMLTMGIAIGTLGEWLGDPARLIDYGVRFTKPVVVDAEAGATLHIVAKLGAITDEAWRVDLTVSCNEQTVLGKAQARVRPTAGGQADA